MSQAQQFKCIVGGQEISLETGKLAGLAGGAVTITQGETMLLATATMSASARPGIDFFPLSVDFEEKLYAAGRIPGSFFRREGRASEGAILTCRLTDRPLRPLFPKDLRNEVQIIVTALSVDGEVQPDILGIVGASAALTVSDIPFGVSPYDGPIGAVRVGMIDDKFVVNPTFSQINESSLDLRIAGTRDAILMVECGADQIPEEIMIDALKFGHESLLPFIDAQEAMANAVGKPKRNDYEKFTIDDVLQNEIFEKMDEKVASILESNPDKKTRDTMLDDLLNDLLLGYESNEEIDSNDVKTCFGSIVKTKIRDRILDGVRPDGRSLTDVRSLAAETSISPRAHGSGLFTRGETQVLSFATLGTPREAQMLDTLSPIDEKRYMHHYNFPPYSVGETGFMRGPKRREIGHGALAETALRAVLPDQDDFAYSLRVVSEVLSSNGSTSMASVCGSTLALMDAGVPIKKPVGGIAMGLVKQDDRYVILTDIQGMEDHLGDMDFKVAGTDSGITALQMDIKITGITAEIMEEALLQARDARLQILGVMTDHISVPREEMSPYAPRMIVVTVPDDKIGAVIGPGGKTIRSLQEETGAKIDVQDDGRVFIAAPEGPSAEEARARVEALTESAEVGRIYTGKVVRIEPFGAFVEIIPGSDGLVHISQLADFRVEKVEDVAKVGEELTVMVTDVDTNGKIRLSRQAVLEGWSLEEARERDKPRKPRSSGRNSRGSGGGRSKNRSDNRGFRRR